MDLVGVYIGMVNVFECFMFFSSFWYGFERFGVYYDGMVRVIGRIRMVWEVLILDVGMCRMSNGMVVCRVLLLYGLFYKRFN